VRRRKASGVEIGGREVWMTSRWVEWLSLGGVESPEGWFMDSVAAWKVLVFEGPPAESDLPEPGGPPVWKPKAGGRLPSPVSFSPTRDSEQQTGQRRPPSPFFVQHRGRPRLRLPSPLDASALSQKASSWSADHE
jgi:hypothetical protein